MLREWRIEPAVIVIEVAQSNHWATEPLGTTSTLFWWRYSNELQNGYPGPPLFHELKLWFPKIFSSWAFSILKVQNSKYIRAAGFDIAIQRRRAESAFSADSARRANVPVAGVKKAGGDATENDDFQIGKQRLQGSIFYITGELVPFRDHRCTNSVHLWSRNGTNRCLI